jgi:hypothetical protein
MPLVRPGEDEPGRSLAPANFRAGVFSKLLVVLHAMYNFLRVPPHPASPSSPAQGWEKGSGSYSVSFLSQIWAPVYTKLFDLAKAGVDLP